MEIFHPPKSPNVQIGQNLSTHRMTQRHFRLNSKSDLLNLWGMNVTPGYFVGTFKNTRKELQSKLYSETPFVLQNPSKNTS